MRKQRKSKGPLSDNVREPEKVEHIKLTPKEMEALELFRALPKEKREFIVATVRGLFESGAISLVKKALAKSQSSI